MLEWLVIALMVGLAAEVTLGVAFRALGRALAWYDEIGVGPARVAHVLRLGAGVGQARAHRLSRDRRRDAWRARRALAIVAQVLVIAFFVLLGGVGAVDPAGARDRHDGEPALRSR